MSMDQIEIIDAHHHFWDLSLKANPWLVEEPPIPFRYGDYSAIRRNFMPEDYDRAAGRFEVAASVTMEGEWREDDLVGETRWMAELRTRTGRPAAHVARAILHRDSVEKELAGHAAHDFVRGIRHKPAAAPAPDRIERGAPGGMTDPEWRRGYAMLARHGLHFELQAPWWHVDELLDLVGAHPETPVVINHTFLPADRSPDGLAGWRRAMARAASAPLISIKISGIGLKGRPWSLADNRRIILEAIDIFGPERAMFASNFPVDGLCGSFETIYAGFLEATQDLGRTAQAALLAGNARRIYRL